MGQLVYGAVGAIAGWFVGGPTGAQWGWAIGSGVGALTAKGPNQVGPRLNDLRIQGTEYGQAIPWVAGGPRLAGQVVWSSGIREISNTEKVGKGGGSKVTTFTYEVDLLIILTENVTDGVAREWLNGGLVYNGVEVKAGTWTSVTVYKGEGDQLPDPIYEAAVGVGNAPAYRGRTSILIQGLQLGNSGQIPNLTSEIRPAVQTIDNRIRLLANWPDGSIDDQSLFDLGPGVKVGNGTASGGVYDINWNAPGQNTITWQDESLVSAYGSTDYRPVTYELIFKPQFHNAVIDLRLATIAPAGSSFPSLPLGIDIFPDGRLKIVPLGSGGGVGHPMYFLSTFAVDDGGPTHIAVTVYGDGTASMWVRGVRVKDRVSWISETPNHEAIVVLGSNAGSEAVDTRVDFFGIRVARAEVYEGTLISEPETLDGDLTNSGASVGEGAEPLHAVVDKLMQRAGYSQDEYDITELFEVVKPVRGMALGQITSTRGPLETLQTAFFFESYTTDKIYFVNRTVDPVADIPFEDLGAAVDKGNDEEPLQLIFGNELELPAQVSLSYANVLADYNVSTEHSDRLLSGQETNQSVQIGLGMLPTEAKAVADANLFDQLASLARTSIRLPLKYAFIRPGHVFLATDRDGRKYRLRSQVKRDSLTIIEHECVIDDVRALTSAGVTSEDYSLSEDIVQVADTAWATMDIPPLRDADASLPGPYVAISPELTSEETTWPGAVYVRSWGAEDYQQILITGDACVMGTCETELLDFVGGGKVFDETQVLRVRVYGELASSTREDILEDLSINAVAIGADGRWEILRFRFAELVDTQDGQNVYDLSSFVRGQRGTEHNMGNHAEGDAFVLLSNRLRRMVNQNSDIDAAAEVKAVTLNTLLSSVTAEQFTDRGVSLKPFSVANLRALADGTDLVLSWQRRSRMSYRYGGTVGVSVPLGEAAEAYRISVYDGSTLINTYSSSTPEFTYTAAAISSDGFGSSDVITFNVAQVSDVVGAGYEETVQGIAP